ncbi:MAG: hypothetical protein LWW82_08535, partial [Comamonadaceae bacterium]|nr:hypothetical protein [Comamonadaceae bacterium]
MAAMAEAVRTPKRLIDVFMSEAVGRQCLQGAAKGLAKEPGDVVEQGDGHHQNQKHNTCALQAFHPDFGH